MHALESFTVIATIFGAPRKVTFDNLGGMAVAGLGLHEARAIVQTLEQATHDKPLLVREPVAHQQPPVRKNKARWAPKEPDKAPVGPAATPQPEPAPVAAPEPEPAVGAPTRAQPQDENSGVSAIVGCLPDMPLDGDAEPERALDTNVDRPEEVAELAAELSEVTNEDAVPPEDVMPEEPTPQPKKRKRAWSKDMKAPPRPNELKELLKKGDKFKDREIVETKDHPDGGRLLTLSDGWRVKIDKTGKEVARMEGLPPTDVSDVKTAAEIQQDVSNDVNENTENGIVEEASATTPSEILETRSSRDVIKWIVEKCEIKEPEKIFAECLRLKGDGCVAFAASANEEAVRRRVNASLSVMGLM